MWYDSSCGSENVTNEPKGDVYPLKIGPKTTCNMEDTERTYTNGNFVTVVSVGDENGDKNDANSSKEVDYVTVLRIGQKTEEDQGITEEVLVYRLPGERLGFGLKFEGGTKATECVKRLFIQSCAPDSPASRVLSSWGNLTEGDEVLVIDSNPVSSMTRMDCVKCLKDSNVIIKLLVRHFKRKSNASDINDSKVAEDLPQVISAEKKKVPPPPPPVPPRKIPRKQVKANLTPQNDHEENRKNIASAETNPLPPTRQKYADPNNNAKISRNHKTRSSSPETKRNRKYSDGSLGPPDAEIYTDLIAQESLHSLSESDDTASTISTVIDKNGSSLPTTPKSIQKHLDISNFPDDDVLFNIISDGGVCNEKLEFPRLPEGIKLPEALEIDDNYSSRELKTDAGVIAEYKTEEGDSEVFTEKFVIPTHDENMNIFSLPRLVDFVPKTMNDDPIKMMNLFLENERSDQNEDTTIETCNNSNFDDDIDIYHKWTVSTQLATIGEVEEESITSESLTDGSTISPSLTTPIVIVQNADDIVDKKEEIPESEKAETNHTERTMEPLSSDFRQPPDGHEFPDFEENFEKTTAQPLIDKFRLNFSDIRQNQIPNKENSSFAINSSDSFTSSKINSLSNTDLSSFSKETEFPKKEPTVEIDFKSLLHTRSQSLCDITFDKKTNDQWQNLVEQRKKSLSRLKGLVIPDSISEVDCAPTINLPEIKSKSSVTLETIKSFDSDTSNDTSQPSSVDSAHFPVILPPWTGSGNFPKYSPAFKRKDLQLHSTIPKDNNVSSDMNPFKTRKNESTGQAGSSSGDDSTLATKSIDDSVESSSECSSSKKKPKRRSNPMRLLMETSFLGKGKKEINTEDESDNDSAVSSSQSSFISHPTTSSSPTRSLEYDTGMMRADFRSSESRPLRVVSVEAVNRQNILASAKCRSGKDLKVGSPVINRKLEESDENDGRKSSGEGAPEEHEDILVETCEELVDAEETAEVMKQDIAVSAEVPEVPQTEARNLPTDPPKCEIPLRTPTSLKTKYETVAVTPKKQKPVFTRSMSRDSAPIFKESLKPVTSMLTKEEKRSRFFTCRSMSVSDLRKNFEDLAKEAKEAVVSSVERRRASCPVRNLASECEQPSEAKGAPPEAKPRSSLQKRSQESPSPPATKCHDVHLKPDVYGLNLGIMITGGTDEEEDIFVHRIRYGSIAYQEGSLTKGDRILALNGISTKGMNQSEVNEILKTPSKSLLVTVAERKDSPQEDSLWRRKHSTIPEEPPTTATIPKEANVEITLKKDGNGLGFSVEGGKDSPQGNVPLIVKKIFQGGVAAKDGRLKVGDQIITINGTDFTILTRIQAWTMMKKIAIGDVHLTLYR